MEKLQGLTQRQAQELLKEYGENVIRSSAKAGALRLFAGQFKDAMVLILLAATALSALLGEINEAFTIIVIVLLNALLGFLQEFRTERTLEKLGELAAPTASVIREGQLATIPAAQVVPGDLFCLKAGDRVPADGLVVEAQELGCDESMLSGESIPVEKRPCPGLAEPPKAGQVYMGTMATRGRAVCRARATGANTEMGRIADLLGGIEAQPTPLQKRLAHMSRTIGIGCLLICLVVAAAGILRGEDPFSMVLVGISLAVAAIPEGLPAVVTIALALSVGRMVRRGALIRRLHAVETLGCANVICSDKTGTLTENRMTVRAVRTPGLSLEVGGGGTEAHGQFTLEGKPVRPASYPDLALLLDIAVLCSNAAVSPIGQDGAQLRLEGEPTEAALLVLAAKAGIWRSARPYRPGKEVPFDSTRKMMSLGVRREDGQAFLFCKGAPDLLLDRCTHYLENGHTRPLSPAMRKKILQWNDQMAAQALRVLGFAFRKAGSEGDVAEQNLVFVGLAGMIDPPRPEVLEAVRKCRQAGIRPVMITGDHAITARAIAGDLGICPPQGRVVTGKELDAMSDDQLARQIAEIPVFARVTPAHKLRIVRALKRQGNVVAMTGDGVNDAPAVKEADIGVAMGITGTDVTKEASSVVLMDDNFATLVAAVEEGRVIYQNIRKFIRYLFSCNIGEVVTMFFAMLMGMPVPLLPIQILLVNLATDGLPAIALGLEPAEEDVMRQKPRRAEESVFSNGLAFTIAIRGLLIGLCTLGAFVSLYRSSQGDVALARTGALSALVLMQLIHVFECKSETKGLFSIPFFNNWKLIGATAISVGLLCLAVWHPAVSALFQTSPLTLSQLRTVLCYCLAVPLVSGVLLALRRRGRLRPQPSAQEALSAPH